MRKGETSGERGFRVLNPISESYAFTATFELDVRMNPSMESHAAERFALLRAVTFDVGGTLVAPHPSVGGIYAEVLTEEGIPADAATIERDFRTAFRHHEQSLCTAEREFWERVFRDACSSASIPADKFSVVFERAYATFARGHRWRVLEGARETVSALRNRGLQLAILSNSDSRFHTVLAELGLSPLFTHRFLSGEVGYEKPDIRLFRHVEAALNLSPEQILHVGDSRRADFEGAKAAGWRAFLVKPPETGIRSLLRRMPP